MPVDRTPDEVDAAMEKLEAATSERTAEVVNMKSVNFSPSGWPGWPVHVIDLFYKYLMILSMSAGEGENSGCPRKTETAVLEANHKRGKGVPLQGWGHGFEEG